ncbi:hypothetical protein SNEBB_003707 [Seison nebaliae]|nr:hypothetical protein SNEBB_003707 [Seison nebaliae]
MKMKLISFSLLLSCAFNLILSESEPNAYKPELIANGFPKSFGGVIREDEKVVQIEPPLQAKDRDTLGGASYICGFHLSWRRTRHQSGANEQDALTIEDEIPFKAEVKNRSNGLAEVRVKDGFSLNCEQVSSYALKVAAFDCGSPPLVSEWANLDIQLLDYNEYRPVFEERSYRAYIEENRIYQSIIQVVAKDKDCNNDGKVCGYRIMNNDTNSPFHIDSKGIISNIVPLEHEKNSNWMLDVSAFDCDGKTSEKNTVVNIIVQQTCESRLHGINSLISITPPKLGNSLDTTLVSLNPVIQICSTQCLVEEVVLRMNIINNNNKEECKCNLADEDLHRQKRLGEKLEDNSKVIEFLPSPEELRSFSMDMYSNVNLPKNLDPKSIYYFDGKTNAYFVPYKRFNATMLTANDQPETSTNFTISWWMRKTPNTIFVDSNKTLDESLLSMIGEGENEIADDEKKLYSKSDKKLTMNDLEKLRKEQILCIGDNQSMSRHHTSIWIQDGHLKFLLRREHVAKKDQSKFFPAEWRWHIPEETKDGKWHFYSIRVRYPQSYLFVDNKQVAETQTEILDDWPITDLKSVGTVSVVGACWHGQRKRFAQRFQGYLAALHLHEDINVDEKNLNLNLNEKPLKMLMDTERLPTSDERKKCSCEEKLILSPSFDLKEFASEVHSSKDGKELILKTSSIDDAQSMLKAVKFHLTNFNGVNAHELMINSQAVVRCSSKSDGETENFENSGVAVAALPQEKTKIIIHQSTELKEEKEKKEFGYAIPEEMKPYKELDDDKKKMVEIHLQLYGPSTIEWHLNEKTKLQVFHPFENIEIKTGNEKFLDLCEIRLSPFVSRQEQVLLWRKAMINNEEFIRQWNLERVKKGEEKIEDLDIIDTEDGLIVTGAAPANVYEKFLQQIIYDKQMINHGHEEEIVSVICSNVNNSEISNEYRQKIIFIHDDTLNGLEEDKGRRDYSNILVNSVKFLSHQHSLQNDDVNVRHTRPMFAHKKSEAAPTKRAYFIFSAIVGVMILVGVICAAVLIKKRSAISRKYRDDRDFQKGKYSQASRGNGNTTELEWDDSDGLNITVNPMEMASDSQKSKMNSLPENDELAGRIVRRIETNTIENPQMNNKMNNKRLNTNHQQQQQQQQHPLENIQSHCAYLNPLASGEIRTNKLFENDDNEEEDDDEEDDLSEYMAETSDDDEEDEEDDDDYEDDGESDEEIDTNHQMINKMKKARESISLNSLKGIQQSAGVVSTSVPTTTTNITTTHTSTQENNRGNITMNRMFDNDNTNRNDINDEGCAYYRNDIVERPMSELSWDNEIEPSPNYKNENNDDDEDDDDDDDGDDDLNETIQPALPIDGRTNQFNDNNNNNISRTVPIHKIDGATETHITV